MAMMEKEMKYEVQTSAHIHLNWLRGWSRTCVCGVVFLTRKDLRIHRERYRCHRKNKGIVCTEVK